MRLAAILLVMAIVGCSSETAETDVVPPEQLVEPVAHEDIPPAPVLTPEDAIADFVVEDGFAVELAASEPDIVAPVALTFDGNGAMWVVEMRGYMSDVDASAEQEPVGRVRVLRDADDDGLYETATTFVDGLVLPRAIAMTKGGILLAEPPNLWFIENHDYVAGNRVVVDTAYAAPDNPEHQENGLLHAMDNWIYSAKSDIRYRLLDGEWIRDSTEFRGQWGISQDDYGRLFYNNNSATLLGDNLLPNDFPDNPNHEASHNNYSAAKASNRVYPRRVNPGVNRGYLDGTLGDDGKLVNVTGACGPVIFRGSNFPESHYGDAFVMEPTGNVVMRVVLSDSAGVVSGSAPYAGREFLSSSDERFRPVNAYTGPDGALYIVDMYRGVIQHKTYLTHYLKRQIEHRDLETPLNLGRIYRVRWTDRERDAAPRLLESSTAELVDNLRHPNGWRRDTAQRLLVQESDPAAEPLVRALISRGTPEVTIVHALWALEGLGVITVADLRRATTAAPTPKVRATALRVAATLGNAPEPVRREAFAFIRATGDSGREVGLQRLLALRHFIGLDDAAVAGEFVDAVSRRGGDAEFVDAAIGSFAEREDRLQAVVEPRRTDVPHLWAAVQQARFIDQLGPALETLVLDESDRDLFSHGARRYGALCATCHGRDGRGLPSTAPELRRSHWVIQDPETAMRILLDGISGPIEVNGRIVSPPEALDIMPGLRTNPNVTDRDIAAVLTYARNAWNNRASAVDSAEVATIRAATRAHAGAPYTADELVALRRADWTPLMPPPDFAGWTKLGGSADFRVVGDEVVGTTALNTPNTFLATDRTFDDFILEFEVRIDSSINSGVQIRSESRSDYQNGRVHGYQVEIDPSDRAWSGGIYDEGRRGWLFDLRGNPTARNAFRRDGWNHYRVEARGPHIRTWINGVLAADLIDDLTPSGFVALQVHSVGSPGLAGREVRWRGIRMKEDLATR